MNGSVLISPKVKTSIRFQCHKIMVLRSLFEWTTVILAVYNTTGDIIHIHIYGWSKIQYKIINFSKCQ